MNRIKEVLEIQRQTQIWLAEKLGKSYNMGEFVCAKQTTTKY